MNEQELLNQEEVIEVSEEIEEKIEEELEEAESDFEKFLHTKGIGAKFKLAFANMKESARKQHEADVKQYREIKEKSKEDNKEFYEFLHTKGLKAKIKLIIENIKKGARESRQNTKKQIQKAKQLSKPSTSITADQLNEELNNFLKQKGLDKKYTIVVDEKE